MYLLAAWIFSAFTLHCTVLYIIMLLAIESYNHKTATFVSNYMVFKVVIIVLALLFLRLASSVATSLKVNFILRFSLSL
jgi:hypothetical protein